MQQLIINKKQIEFPSINLEPYSRKLKSGAWNLMLKLDSVIPDIPVKEAKPLPTFKEFLRISFYAIAFLTWFLSAYYGL